jgi:hypothetical protein
MSNQATSSNCHYYVTVPAASFRTQDKGFKQNTDRSEHFKHILKMHTLQSLFYLTTALRVSGVTITHFQEHKSTVTTASGNLYTVTDTVKLIDKEYR